MPFVLSEIAFLRISLSLSSLLHLVAIPISLSMVFSSGMVIVSTSPSVIGGSSSSVEATHSRGLFLLCPKMSASQYWSFFLVYWCGSLSTPWRWSILFRARIASLHASCLLHLLWYMDRTVSLIFSTPWPVNDLKGVSSLMNWGRW